MEWFRGGQATMNHLNTFCCFQSFINLESDHEVMLALKATQLMI
jgi:hypothetical protein